MFKKRVKGSERRGGEWKKEIKVKLCEVMCSINTYIHTHTHTHTHTYIYIYIYECYCK
jgi:hypothetical protein